MKKVIETVDEGRRRETEVTGVINRRTRGWNEQSDGG
jgi:hypothetical protein